MSVGYQRIGILLCVFAIVGCGSDDPTPGRSATVLQEPTRRQGSTLDAGPSPRAPALRTLEREAPGILGNAYACVVAPAPQDSKLILYVTAPDALAMARKFIRQIDSTRYAIARVAPSHARYDDRRRIIRELQGEPPPEGVIIVEEEANVGRTTCPRAVIALPSSKDTPPRARAWAQEAVRRYGAQQVVIEYRELNVGTGP